MTSSMMIVAGRPVRTPRVNRVTFCADSPWTDSQMMLSRLTSGKAAIMPPYTGNLLANSVMMPIIAAELKIFMNIYIYLDASLSSLNAVKICCLSSADSFSNAALSFSPSSSVFFLSIVLPDSVRCKHTFRWSFSSRSL
jgi:hypothetical protein